MIRANRQKNERVFVWPAKTARVFAFVLRSRMRQVRPEARLSPFHVLSMAV